MIDKVHVNQTNFMYSIANVINHPRIKAKNERC